MTEKTIEVYADTRGVSTCRGQSCREKIIWAEIVGSKRKMCFQGDAVPLRTRYDESHRLIEAFDFNDNHWAHCPDRERFAR